MKTKQLLTLTLLLLGVFLAREAQAFYNPSTGRWLSRDPIGEKGGQNLYGFVQNDAIHRSDAFGLSSDDDGDDNCFCGKSVDDALQKVLDEISTIFDTWDSTNKCKACEQLVSLNGKANKAWDIKELVAYGAKSKVGCNRKVTFQGHCFFGGAINYAMFGRIMSKCNKVYPSDPRYFKSIMEAGIIYHKIDIGDDILTNLEALQALQFAYYGWGGGEVIPIENGCAPDFDSDVRTFTWVWKPVKNSP